MARVIKILFFAFIVKPIVFVLLGLNIRGKNNLPSQGPAILVANHNSHLDTLVLMSLYPLSQLHKIRPVAAADYFMKNRLRAWFALNCIGIIPLKRGTRTKPEEMFSDCHKALDDGDILIVFPEGSRGLPEEMSSVKKGVFRIVNNRTKTTITPIVMHGLGKALPRGEALFVPFNCDVIIGDPLPLPETAHQFIEDVINKFEELQTYCITRN